MQPLTTHLNGTPFLIGVTGSGPEFKEVMNLLLRDDFAVAFPEVKLACVNGRGLPLPQSIPFYESVEALTQAMPDMDLLIVTDDADQDAARRNLPEGASLLNARAAGKLWRIMLSEQLCIDCRLHLEKAKSLFTTVIDELEEDVLLLDLDGRIIDLNRAAYSRRGLSREEMVGRHCWDVEGRGFCCDDHNGGCPLSRTVSSGEKAENVHSFVDDEGHMHFYRIYTYPVHDGQKVTSVLEIRRDITTRTNMELKLQQSEKMAAIGELATYIAHEIRNPMFAIGGFANSLLRSPSLDEPAREKVGIILDESKRMDKILKSLLNFAKPTDAKETVIDVNRVVQEVHELMSIGCDRQGIATRMELEPDMARAMGDPELLKQCVINIFKNAVEAMPDGGDLIIRTLMAPDRVVLQVEDTGSGIPEDIRSKVFNPFFSTKNKGSGFGLAMTKKIIEDMGGEVDLISRPGEGTRVTLSMLPRLAVATGLPTPVPVPGEKTGGR